MKELFGQPYDKSDPCWIAKGYFDRMYNDGDFIECISYIGKRWGFTTDGAGCSFPDANDSSELIKMACDTYLQRHPEDTAKIKELLDQLPL